MKLYLEDDTYLEVKFGSFLKFFLIASVVSTIATYALALLIAGLYV